MEYVGMNRLKIKLSGVSAGVGERYRYYDGKATIYLDPATTPPEMQHAKAVLGWCATAVDSLADRLVFRGFGKDNFGLNEIFQMNNMDVLCHSAILAALIGGCSFIYISADEAGYPRMRVLDGLDATGIIDPITHMLKEGYAVLERDPETRNPTLEAHFIKGLTTFYPKGQEPYTIENNAPYPLLVPVINRPDATRAFGHSRITRPCMALTKGALRTLVRSEIAAKFYSFPQRWLFGMDSEAEQLDRWQMAMTAILRIDKDADGDRPVTGQYQQQSMAPFNDQIQMFASLFAGETGLTLGDLGFSDGAAASSETIRATHEKLRLAARKAQRDFGTGFLNAGFLAACVRDENGYLRQVLYDTVPKFMPIFEPDMGSLGVIGDAVYKIRQSFPEYFDEDKLLDLTGI